MVSTLMTGRAVENKSKTVRILPKLDSAMRIYPFTPKGWCHFISKNRQTNRLFTDGLRHSNDQCPNSFAFVDVIYSETGFKAERREGHDTSFQSIVLRQDCRLRAFCHALGLDNDQAHHVLHVWLGVHRPLGC